MRHHTVSLQQLNFSVFKDSFCYYLRQEGDVFIDVSLLARLSKNYSVNFHKILWKGGTWAMEDTIHSGGNPDHIVMVRVGWWSWLWLGLGDGHRTSDTTQHSIGRWNWVVSHNTGYVLSGSRLTVTMKKALRETQTLHAKNFRPATDPLPGGVGSPKFNQLEMVTTCTYRPSLVKINAHNFALSW